MQSEIDAIHDLANYLKSNELSLEETLYHVTEYAKRKSKENPEDAAPSLAMVDLSCRTLLTCLTSSGRHFTKDTFADLLDVLAMAESYRLRIIDQAERAIVWHEYFVKHEPDQALSDKEANTHRKICENQQDWKDIYSRIVEKAIALDLYYIFISDPWSLTDFFVRFFEYFPSSSRATDSTQTFPCRCLEHLTGKEREILFEKCQREIHAFVNESFDWLQQRPQNVSILDALHSKEFREEYPPPHNLQRFRKLAEEYLKQIRKTSRILLGILPGGG